MSYNKKEKMIKIEQYEKDPKREGHEIKVSVLTKKSPKPIVPSKPKPPKPIGMPKWFKAWSETVYQNQQPAWFKVWSEGVYQKDQTILGSRLDTIDSRLVNLENRMTNVEVKLEEHDKRFERIEVTLKDHGETIGKLGQKLDRVITLNNLKS